MEEVLPNKASQCTVIGLGNPGDRYVRTRHNVGAEAVLRAATLFDVDGWNYDSYADARVARAESGQGALLTFVLPETYMNRSGESVRVLCGTHEVCGELIVVHDDIDLPEGVVRIVHGRGHGGHNGVRSVEAAIDTRTFTRVRIGVLPVVDGVVRKPTGEGAASTFVLKRCSSEAWERMESYAQRAAEAVRLIVEEGRDAAMRKCNVREKQVNNGGVTRELGDGPGLRQY